MGQDAIRQRVAGVLRVMDPMIPAGISLVLRDATIEVRWRDLVEEVAITGIGHHEQDGSRLREILEDLQDTISIAAEVQWPIHGGSLVSVVAEGPDTVVTFRGRRGAITFESSSASL